MKILSTFLLACLLGGECPADIKTRPPSLFPRLETLSSVSYPAAIPDVPVRETMTGDYLASQFAQRHHDWGSAARFIGRIIENDPENTQLLSKAMVLGMGSGDHARAIAQARTIQQIEPDNALALMFLAVDAFQRQAYVESEELAARMPEGTLSGFLRPPLLAWAKAGQGAFEAGDLYTNTVHIHHAVLIADYLGKQGEIPAMLRLATGAQSLSLQDVERIADGYAHIGEKDAALKLYNKALEEWPDNPGVLRKIVQIGKDGAQSPMERVKTPAQGLALALTDMALLLFDEHSDESARVFASLALYVDPGQTKSAITMAQIAARNDRPLDAIASYRQISPADPYFLEAQREAASLMAANGRKEEAMGLLDSLARDYNDVDALIAAGDIHRQDENFKAAAQSYSDAESRIADAERHKHWHLYYLRGMAYEQMKEWDKAEADLKAALAFQPENPYVLNYLGYSWADQGVNLEKSLEMIRQASAQRPEDGYITDSLGWVLYRMGRHEEAIAPLERAVELLPYDAVINDHLGDAYWRVGRRLEARFQWQRARNHAEDEKLAADIGLKLSEGLPPAPEAPMVKEASTQTGDGETARP